MSGRSAYVRKQITKTNDLSHDGRRHTESRASDRDGDFALRSQRSAASSGSDERRGVRHRKSHAIMEAEAPTAIEKSSFRSLLDKRSEGVRRGLAKTFGAKKKSAADEVPAEPPSRPQTAAARDPPKTPLSAPDRPRRDEPLSPKSSSISEPTKDLMDSQRPPPPTIRLPPTPQVKRWIGHGRPPQAWNKLRKDPELWDPNGDTLVYFGHPQKHPRPPPSFRVSSRVIEATESRFLITLLRQGLIDDPELFERPHSPSNDPAQWPLSVSSRASAMTHDSMKGGRGDRDLGGEISYEIFFPSPSGKSKMEVLRFQITTRNLFAMLYQASFVGLSLYQGLNDLLERLDLYMPAQTDNPGWIIDWLTAKGIDDVRGDPNSAAAMLAWSESDHIHWHEGWIESFVHCAGMFTQVEECPEYKSVSTITRALLERASLETQVRVQSAEERLHDFDFSDMWPWSRSTLPARISFNRLQQFLLQHYTDCYGSWPPKAADGEEIWLTRSLAQALQNDFGALYNYVVDRDVEWTCLEESSSRKWTLTKLGEECGADSDGLPMTDMLVAFDNQNRYPHIPHPYPLTPASIGLGLRDVTGTRSKSAEDKMMERKAALAYAEACNIYILGSEFVGNNLVDAFVRFERSDHAAEIDPFEARRGRWVLLYGILQALATVSVDTPGLRYTKDVPYYLNPRLRGTPPWKTAEQLAPEEASHQQSFCWTISQRWQTEPTGVSALLRQSPPQVSMTSSNMSATESVSSIRTPTMTSERDFRSLRLPRHSGFSGIAKKLDDWRINDEDAHLLVPLPSSPAPVVVKDFDQEIFP